MPQGEDITRLPVDQQQLWLQFCPLTSANQLLAKDR
jgi:hypothetical protein